MSVDPERRRRSKQEVAERASAARTTRHCGVLGCKNLTRAGAGQGLNNRYCKKHEEHHQRHGSPFRGSYGADWLNPYRRAAFDWLTSNPENFWVKNAIAGVEGLYHTAGRAVEAYSLRGLKPEERARVAWARLRKAKIDPRLPLAAWIAIEMIVRDDPQAVRTTEYKRVQAAKIINRIVSGSHRRWEVPRWDGGVLEKLLEAARILAPVPQAMQLRYLATLFDIANERSSTIVFPFPIDLQRAWSAGGAERAP